MALRVAACPRCQQALVFGERACRACGQTFQYQEPGPPIPTAEQVREALLAAGLLATDPPAAPAPVSSPGPHATLADLDTGRFDPVATKPTGQIEGFVASSVFAAYTPARVRSEPVDGLDLGRFEEVGAVEPAFTPGLEVSPRDEVGEIFVQPVPGVFRSDIYATPEHVAELAPVEGFEPTIAGRPTAAPRAAPKRAREGGELGKIVCRCSEAHRLPRCPACGTPHPDS